MSTSGKKIKVAFFGDDFSRQGKGTALVIQKIAEELVARHFDTVEVILLRPEGECNSKVCASVRSVIVHRRFSTLLSYLWFFITHKDRYDAVVFNRVVYPGFFFLRAKKSILFAYDASISEVYTVPRTWVNRVFEYFLRFIGRYFLDTVVAVSNDARDWIIRYYNVPASRVRTIYPAAGDEYMPYDGATRAARRTQLAERYRITSPYILDVSRFDPHKNIDRMLDAFFILKTKHRIPHSLVLVGGRHTQGYSDLVLAKIRNSPHRDSVVVLDYVKHEDMPALYNCADVLAYPSLVEGFGLPIVEAMQCGTPVVTSAISSMPEVAKGAAVLVDPMSADSIAGGVLTVLTDTDTRRELIRKGLLRAGDFSWSKSADDLVRLVN